MSLKPNSIVDGRYRLIEFLGDEGERFGEVWRVLDEENPDSSPEVMVVSDRFFDGKTYTLIRQLGSGGFGEVWKARKNAAGIDVALKIHKLSDSVQGTNQIVKEYTRVMGIHHDNLLTPNHVNIVDGRTAYLEMELCRCDLTEAELNEEQMWRLIRDVASGLKRLAENRKWSESQHRYIDNPIIHQDIKPANILLRSNGMYAISDFGISKRKLSSLTTADNEKDDNADSWMTVDYAAPERFPRGVGQAGLASDIWSLGAMLFELVDGRRPFEIGGGNCLNAKMGLKIPAIKSKSCSYELKQLIYDCMAKEPAARPTASQLLEYAEEVITGKPRKVVWTGIAKQTKADQSKRITQFKGLQKPMKEEKTHPSVLTTMSKWLVQHKKSLLRVSFVGIIIAMGLVFLPRLISTFDNAERKAWRTAKQENTFAAYKTFIENYGNSGYVDNAITGIMRLYNTDQNIQGIRYVLQYVDSCMTSNTEPNMSPITAKEIQDSVKSLCVRWICAANDLSWRVEQYTFDRDYSQTSELTCLDKLSSDALRLDSVWALMDNEFLKRSDSTYRYIDPKLNEVSDSIFNTLIKVQNKFDVGESALHAGEIYAPKENADFYKEAQKCIRKYFDNRHYSNLSN